VVEPVTGGGADPPAEDPAEPAGPGEPAGGPPAEGPPAEDPAGAPEATPGPEPTAPPAGEEKPGPAATPPPATDEEPRPGADPPTPGKLTVAATTSNATRLSWPAAGGRTRYAVAVDGRVIGTTTATRVRVVGLKPATAYRMQVGAPGADGDLRPHTRTATVRTASAARPTAGRWLVLGNALTGGVAQLSGSRGADGTPLVLGARDAAADQQWQLRAVGGGRFLVRSRATGKCVAPLGPAGPGAVLTQRPCSVEDAAQRWRVVADSHGYALSTGSLVVGVSRLRFGGQRLLVLQRPGTARYQSWVAQPR
jgi:chitodextrinase